MTDRTLASTKRITQIEPISGADNIELATVMGWKVVVKKSEYKVGDLAIYCEIDSWIPHALAPFLSKGKEPREYKGVLGEKLRSIKLRKTLSQGLLLPTHTVTGLCPDPHHQLDDDQDVTEALGILMWEREVPAQLRGTMKGNFPSFIRKTDQARIQNLTRQYEKFKEHQMEVTEKLEGSSLTAYFNNGEFSVCSRNIDLKETEDSTFWKAANKYHLRENMQNLGLNIAIQGELVGAGIQGNIYNIHDYDFYVYDVFDIDKQEYMPAEDRYALVESLGLNHVPLLGHNWHYTTTIQELLEMADGKSELNPKQDREGIVLKALDGSFSFKAVSNKYLLVEKD